jgi:hypothetical protein
MIMLRQNSILTTLFSLFLMVSFFVSTATPARAFFHDEEISSGNLLTAGAVSLTISLSAWDDETVAANLGDGATASQTIEVDTSLVVTDRPTEYRLVFDQATVGLCGDLFAVVEHNSAQVAAGPLGELAPVVPVGAGSLDTWRIHVSPLGDRASSGGACELRYRFSAYLTDIGPGAGFFDEQEVQSTISSTGFGAITEDTDAGEGDSDTSEEDTGEEGDEEGHEEDTPPADDEDEEDPTPDPAPDPSPAPTANSIVLNEVTADAVAEWDHQLSGNEWIELYNTGTEVVDLNGWLISEYSGTTEKFYTIKDAPEANDGDVLYTKEPGTTISPGHFRVVIFANANKLNNNFRSELGWADQVSLYTPFDYTDEDLDRPEPIDSMNYEEAVDERSEGRVPDGIGTWQKTERTPLAPNIAKPIADTDDE